MGKVFKALNKADSTGKNDVAQEPRVTTSTGAGLEPQDAYVRLEPAQLQPVPPAFAAEKPGQFQQEEAVSAVVARGWDERLIAAYGTDSEVAEEFRRLRTHILHPPGGEKPARTILVASASPEEGKTFVCAGLAISFAQGVGAHALMIDCDLRRPALAGVFGLGNEPGLADHLREKVDLGRLIRKTGLRKLSLIASGPPPANPAELLGSDMLGAMVDEVAKRYPDRYIFFDSPPLQKAAETAILARQVDGVVLVVREGKSRRENIRQLMETIGPEKIIGVVFNAYQINFLERRSSGYYGNYKYSSYGISGR